MSDSALRALAEAAGMLPGWRDFRGDWHEVAPDTLRAVLSALELPCATPEQAADSLRSLGSECWSDPSTGLRTGFSRDASRLKPLQQRAPSVGDLVQRQRLWGVSAQLYSLRRAGDGGLGDFTALAGLARALARRGADALALSPVHAPLAADPARHSPYMPSNRLMLNPLHVDPAQAARSLGEAFEIDDVRAAKCRQLEQAPLVDWPEATRMRLGLLRDLYRRVALRLDHDQEFRAFRMHGGQTLEDHARFEALHGWHHARGDGDWRAWPAAWRDARGAAVAQFAREHASEVGFHVFLQYLADRGLDAAQAAARHAGMAIGLVSDLAVGVDPAGSRAWSHPGALLRGLSLGAPPDALNLSGQNWGLTTFSPRVLARERGEPLLEVLRAALRHAGGVRIDHVLGLNRLWVIPEGADPTQGAYLRCPLGALLDGIAREARERGAIVIGEDLGTVPPELLPHLEAAGLLGLRVLWFMRDHGLFVEPSRWPRGAVAMTTTHDLPSVAGWWQARDLDWRERAGQFADGEAAAERAVREADRQVLWDALLHAGVARGARPVDAASVVDAALRFVACTPAPLALFPLEDVCGLVEQPNLPGTVDQHPNWRRRLLADAVDLLDEPAIAARLDAVRDSRNRP